MKTTSSVYDRDPEINALRKASGVSAVLSGHVPERYRQHILARCGWDGFSKTGPNVLRHAASGQSARWLDHYGSTVIDGAELLVAEPYRLGGDAMLGVLDFARRAGLTVSFEASGWRYPGQTIRILFEIPQETELENGVPRAAVDTLQPEAEPEPAEEPEPTPASESNQELAT